MNNPKTSMHIYAFIIDIIAIEILFVIIELIIEFILPFTFDDFLIGSSLITSFKLGLILSRDSFGIRSPGRYFTRTKVCNIDNSNPISPWTCLIRNLFLFLGPIELIALIINKENRRIGDLVTKTRVSMSHRNTLCFDFRGFAVFVVASLISLCAILLIMSVQNRIPFYQIQLL